jgi:hypothetical protein
MTALHTAIKRLDSLYFNEVESIIGAICYGVSDSFPDLKKEACSTSITAANLFQVSNSD